MKKDYQTHVFTSTYTADVSGVCSAMYELGGMSILHDPSGCNSTYSTHDEPRWFDSDSLMYVSGLDEITAVMGDDNVLIRDAVQAAHDLHPRFITLCGASIPHIIAFDFRGVAYLIEQECAVPVLPVPTDGLKSYTSGVGLALQAFLDRFADPREYRGKFIRSGAGDTAGRRVNLVGVTPLDFSVNGNVRKLRECMESAGYEVNCCMAMGDSFEQICHAYRADLNVVVSSAGRKPAKRMKKKSGLPYVEGLPVGKESTGLLLEAMEKTLEDGKSRSIWEENREGEILVIGEEIFAKSLSTGINLLFAQTGKNLHAYPMWPDENEGIAEEDLIPAVRRADVVIADPLYRVVLPKDARTQFIDFPHEAYSGRIYRKEIPEFCGADFSIEKLLTAR